MMIGVVVAVRESAKPVVPYRIIRARHVPL